MPAVPPWLAARASISAGKIAVECGGERVRYAELERRVRAVAHRLRGLGVRERDVVGVLLGNGLPFVEQVHALAACGATILPLNVRLTAAELAVPLRDSGARLLLHGRGALAELAASAAEASPGLKTALADPLPVRPDSGGAARSAAASAFDASGDRAIVYTSGTSGVPRGAILTHENFLWSAVASAFHLGVRPDDRWLACLPLFHVGGLSILLRSVLYGTAVVVHERFDPARVSRSLDADRITLASLVPTMLERILDARGDRPAPSTLRCVLLGGAAAPASLLERARALGFPMAPSYGLTEATSQVATRPPDGDANDAPAGLVPLLGTQLRVVAADGRDLPPGESGEILVRGPTVMRGYVDRGAASHGALRDGWLHTGDVGSLCADGSLQVAGRRDDLIVSGGENISPAEVEAVLLQHPEVAEAGVAGVADPEYGQRPVAWLVPRGGCAPSADALRDFCRARIAGYKVPVAFRCVRELPRTASGKLLRRRLAQDAEGGART
ncbi:MAG: o-succinylbenzoate--CoA ligase [Deltaproteobacteria bacterium]|nr:MAG: o-succinylbenzoate--CoA ligase [Deltaproteobacteria bacterium]